MKQITSIILVLFCVSTFSQNLKPIAQKIANLQTQRVEFKPFKVLEKSSEEVNQRIASTVTNYTLAKLQSQAVSDIYQNKYPNIEITLPYNNKDITVQLYKVNVTTDSFVASSNRSESLNVKLGVYYRGIVKGDNESIVSLSFFNNKLSGIISSTELANLNIGKLEEKGNTEDYVIYSDRNLLIENTFNCGVDSLPTENIEPRQSSMELTPNMDDKCVTVYFEIDNNIFVKNNSDVQETTDWVTSIFNNVQTLYTNDDINIALNNIMIWEDQDPYQGLGFSSPNYLLAFQNTRKTFPADVGQLLGIDPGGLGGVAFLNSLCTNNNYSYSDLNSINVIDVPTYSWEVMVITHEFGHSLGSPHTHSCSWNGDNTAIDGCAPVQGDCTRPPMPTNGGTIMSYCHIQPLVGINLNNGFGEQPRTLIRNTINAKTCLSEDCVATCFRTVKDITFTNITETSANVTWTDDISDNWYYKVVNIQNNNVLIDWTNTTTKNIMLSDLETNVYYDVQVRNNCDALGLTTASRKGTIATDADFCSGILFTDSGRESANYSDQENVIRTILPNDTSSEKLKVTFTELNLEKDYDYLKVYNGTDTNAPLLGNYTGNVTPLPVLESTDASGALTFHFISDEYETTSGWVATFECNTLGLNEAGDYIDFSYSPNPVVDYLNINAKNTIEAYQVYSVDGKKLQNQTSLKEKSAKIDLSNYPSGTYVIQLQFKNKPVSFKVVKK